MLNIVTHLIGAKVSASDGDIGVVADVFLDDWSWVIRYLVVDTGSGMNSRRVLVSPYSIMQPLDVAKHLHLNLTQEQVRKSPDVDTQQPVSRQHERALLRYYNYPDYWVGAELWGASALPYAGSEASPALRKHSENASAVAQRDIEAADEHLRSSNHVMGYQVQASNDSIGEVLDFIFDQLNWAVRYALVDTGSWWPGGRKVLVGVHWVDHIDWASRSFHVRLTREQVRGCPAFENAASIKRDYEARLHFSVQRPGYWS